MILPRMIPIGDIDEDELLLQTGGFSVSGADQDLDDIPPAISGLRRQMLLARLIRAQQNITPDQALKLAHELALLLDQVHTERLDLADLAKLVPADFAEHWQITLQFLEILSFHWPQILAAEDVIDPAYRRNLLINRQAELWRTNPPSGHIIAAGSTGSIPATADLLSTIANMERGAVILPGLDRDMPGVAWDVLGPHHPQFGLCHLLKHLNVRRDQVTDWQADHTSTAADTRCFMVNRSLHPAHSHAVPNIEQNQLAAAFENVELINAQGPLEEAAAIALIMREVLQTPGKTAALVTPDRNLARRTRSGLARFGIRIDDSAGTPLGQTPVGTFFRLSVRMVVDGFAPVALLSALKHPFSTCGLGPGQFKHQVRQLEIALLRGPRPDAGIKGLRHALSDDATDLHVFLDTLEHITGPLNDLLSQKSVALDELLTAHIRVIESLAATDIKTGPERLWHGDDGEALAGFVHELLENAAILGDINLAHYPSLIDTLIQGRLVRSTFGLHPRLHIWGLMEARLQHADVMILGSLNEGTWPPDANANPWMSRPMLKNFGLPQPERRIGLTAHDFVQSLSAKQIYMTRSERIEGAPSQPSRWLLRLQNTLAGLGQENLLSCNLQYLYWAEKLDQPDTFSPARPPQPKPNIRLRPTGLSVSRIETWIRDPYALYAEKILKLKPLDAIDADPNAAERGTIIHHILELFLKRFPDQLPDDSLDKLLSIGHSVFENHLSRPGVRAFWWPRFKRIAQWFVDYEQSNRAQGKTALAVEVMGKMPIDYGADDVFTLTAKVDRIDQLLDGSLHVIDYKTGTPPSAPQVETGLTPQLSLEAAMIKSGAFENISPESPVSALVYIQLSGGRVPGLQKQLKLDAEAIADKALNGLRGHIRKYAVPSTAYLSHPRPMFESRFGDYNHLARVKEWQNSEGGD